jgi:hypothetical protein
MAPQLVRVSSRERCQLIRAIGQEQTDAVCAQSSDGGDKLPEM